MSVKYGRLPVKTGALTGMLNTVMRTTILNQRLRVGGGLSFVALVLSFAPQCTFVLHCKIVCNNNHCMNCFFIYIIITGFFLIGTTHVPFYKTQT